MGEHDILASNLLDLNVSSANFEEKLLNLYCTQLLIINCENLHDDGLLQLRWRQLISSRVPEALLLNIRRSTNIESKESLVVYEHVRSASLIGVDGHLLDKLIGRNVIDYHEISIDVSHFLVKEHDEVESDALLVNYSLEYKLLDGDIFLLMEFGNILEGDVDQLLT